MHDAIAGFRLDDDDGQVHITIHCACAAEETMTVDVEHLKALVNGLIHVCDAMGIGVDHTAVVPLNAAQDWPARYREILLKRRRAGDGDR